MLQSENADDYCVCSGVSVSLRKIVEYIFDKLDINLNRIVVDDNLIRNNELKEIYGDNSKIRANLNWNYNMSFFSVIDILINEELQNQ